MPEFDQLVPGVPLETQAHLGGVIAKIVKRPENTGICGGYATAWMQRRVWRQSIDESHFNSYHHLQRVVARLQASQEPNDPTGMFKVGSLRVVSNPFGKLLDKYEVPDGCAIYCSVSDCFGDSHGFAIDTSRPEDKQLADVGSGIFRVEAASAQEIFDAHVALLNKGLAAKSGYINEYDIYEVAPCMDAAFTGKKAADARAERLASVKDQILRTNMGGGELV